MRVSMRVRSAIVILLAGTTGIDTIDIIAMTDMTDDTLVPPTITCVDCGGISHLLREPEPPDEWQPGDVASYRCADCMDRWDIVVGDPDQEEL